MSLINDALRKAQQARTQAPNLAPSLSGGAPTPAPSGHSPKFWWIVAALGGTTLAFACSLLLSVYIYHDVIVGDAQPAAASPAPQPSATPDHTTTTTLDTAHHTPIAFKPPEPIANTPPIAPPTQAPPPAATPPNPAPSSAAHTPPATAQPQPPAAVTDPPNVPPPTPKAEPAPDPAMAAIVERIQVRGIFSNRSKVLIFDPQTRKSIACAPGDPVDSTTRLKVYAISDDSIQLIDHGGFIYTKFF